MGLLIPQPRTVRVDGSGSPYAGALRNVYLPATTTRVTLYGSKADADAATNPIANPVVADANGIFPPVYVADSITEVRVVDTTDDTVQLSDDDNIPVFHLTASQVSAVLTRSIIGSKLYDVTGAEATALVTPTDYGYPPGDVRRYGAVVGGTASTNRLAFQNAMDSNSEVFVPDGTFTVDDTLNWNDGQVIRFQSRNAVLKASITKAILKGKNAASTRRYRLQIYSGKIDGTSRANAGSYGIDLYAASMCKVFGTEITNVETAVRCGGSNGPPELGSFYNDFYGVDIITVVNGYVNETLGNHINVVGGRINDCTTGTRDNDNTGNTYTNLAIESFSSRAHWCADTSATLFIRYINSRVENYPVGVGAGFVVSALAQDTFITAPHMVGLLTDITDNGARTTILGASEYHKFSGGSRFRKLTNITVTRDVASLASTASRQEGPFTVSGARVGDSLTVTLPSTWPNGLLAGPCIVTANDTVYFNLYNPTGGALDPASGDFVFHLARTTA